MKRILILCLPVFMLIGMMLSGCATSTSTMKALASEPPVMHWNKGMAELNLLPKPNSRIPVSVWRIEDETGQNKESRSGGATELSKAVPQSATSMVRMMLLESGWFDVVPMDSWPQMRETFRIVDDAKRVNGANVQGLEMGYEYLTLPRYMIVGGITGFSSSVMSGGLGAAFRGFDVSLRAKVSEVTIDLQIVDLKTGTVVAAISQCKRILSWEGKAGVYRFLDIDKLLEVEAGMATNDPIEVCVRWAFSSGVKNLICKAVTLASQGDSKLAAFGSVSNPGIFKDIMILEEKAYKKAKDEIAKRMEKEAAKK